MIGLEEAQARLLALAAARPVVVEHVPLIDAAGRFLAEDVAARRNQPAADLSAMDGYAVSAANLTGPWTVIGESAAGNPSPAQCGAGDAVRIFTGAVLPVGADTIIMQEDVAHDGAQLSLLAGVTLRPTQHVRRKAGDFAEGKSILIAGTQLTPARIGLAAAAGYANLPVRKTVTVTIISTGDELVPLGEPTELSQIPASNDVMLSVLLARPGLNIASSGIVPDTRPAIAAALQQARVSDIIITIGGASVGDHDLVRPVLLEAGAEIDFWKVAMKPGKPLMAGMLGDTLVLGLPGNPVSAYVTALLFAAPLIESLRGNPLPLPTRTTIKLATPMPQNGPRIDHVRAEMTVDGVRPIGVNDSAALSALSQADCLIVRAPHAPAAQAKEMVETLHLS